MAIQNWNDTKIPMIYNTGLYNEKGYDLGIEHTDKILDILVNTVTTCLADIKSKNYPVVYAFKKTNGELIVAAIVQYFEGEDGNPGNWNYSWTFDETDIPENAMIVGPYDPEHLIYATTYAHTKYSLMYTEQNYAGEMFTYLMSTIKSYLNDNASESEEWGVKLDGVIQFRVVVEDGEKILSAEPDGEIKQLIKDDAAIES